MTPWEMSCGVCTWTAHSEDGSATTVERRAINHYLETGHSPIGGRPAGPPRWRYKTRERGRLGRDP